MYQIGDLIVYGGEGVCKIDEIGVLDIPSVNGDKLYYTLSPLYRNGKVFTPVDTAVLMRPIISKEDALELIKQIPSIKSDACQSTNFRVLGDQYRLLLQSYECADMLLLIKSTHTKREATILGRGKPNQTDERYMKRAEDMLYSEFAVALSIPKDDVKGYIEDAVKNLEQ